MQNLFNVVDIANHFFHFFGHYKFLDYLLNFNNFSGDVLNLNHFLNLFLNFFELLDDHRDLDYFLNYLLNVVVDAHEVGHYFLDFDYLGNFDHDLS